MKNACQSKKKCIKRVILLLFIVAAAGIWGVMTFLGRGVMLPPQSADNPPAVTNASPPISIDGVYMPKSVPISDFHLTDNHGQPFNKANLIGKWTMLFFGFTHCKYVCPVTMTELNHMYDELSKTLPEKDLPQVVFISVDPERDSVSRMDNYVTSYNPHFIGARGEIKDTEELERQLNVLAVKVQRDKSKADYSMDHSAEIFLFNPNGELQAYLAYPHKAKQMVKDYTAVLNKSRE